MKTLVNLFNPQIRPVRETDLPTLVDLAKEDNHGVLRPTHVVRRDNELIGYISVGALPTVLVWMDSRKAKVRDSLAVATFFENLVSPAGGVIVPVPTTSPFYTLMEKGGYQDMGTGTIFMKGL